MDRLLVPVLLVANLAVFLYLCHLVLVMRRSLIHGRSGVGTEDRAMQLQNALADLVEEVERASTGLERLAMWPAFYSHIVHVHRGAQTPATPDGRRAGEPLSEALGPSAGTPGTSLTRVLRAMAELPFDEAAYMAELGVDALHGERGYTTLERRWTRPTLDICGLTAGYQGEGAKTVIPATARAKLHTNWRFEAWRRY